LPKWLPFGQLFIFKINGKMQQSFINKLIKKAIEKEDSTFIKSIKRLKRAYTEEEQRMNENVERYCEGTMPEIEKKLFEFKLRSEPILKELMEVHLRKRPISN
jgi:hypothetical protein